MIREVLGGMISCVCVLRTLAFESSAWRACRTAHFSRLLPLFFLCSVGGNDLLVMCVRVRWGR